MSAPQPPDDPTAPSARPDPDPTRPDDTADSTRTYEFHGEELDFDPYRFGAPEPVAPTWGAPPPSSESTDGRPPEPGARWTPGGADPTSDVRPGDYWQGGGSQPSGDAVFPPRGYSPPPTGGGTDRVGLDKPPAAPGAYAPPSHPGYPPPGGYPHAPGGPAKRGNGLAVAGLVVGIVGLVLALTSWPGILVGLTGLGLSIAGLVRARRGAPMKGLAIAGILCSAVAVVASSIILVVVLSRVDFTCVRDAGNNFEQAQECIR